MEGFYPWRPDYLIVSTVSCFVNPGPPCLSLRVWKEE